MQRATGISIRHLSFYLAGSFVIGTSVFAADGDYGVHYQISPDPTQGTVRVDMAVKQSSALLRELRMTMPSPRFENISGQGHVVHDQGRTVWIPPTGGGSLSWTVHVSNLRDARSYDAILNSDWGLFRSSDIIPPAATRTRAGARSITTLSFTLPAGWSAATQYKNENGRYSIDNPERRYDRPTGWILLGAIGTRTDTIAGIRVTIAAPLKQSARRMDMLAFLRWTLPEATRVFDGLPERLTIFTAGDPMWRGGLSAPASVFIHADRPLISENSTSTLLHEISHVGMGFSAKSDADWIEEGLAEYFSLQLLRKSDGISESRYRRSLQKLTEWGDRAQSLCSENSSGAVTAKAAAMFANLDSEIRRSSEGKASLDDVTSALAQLDKKISLDDIRRAAREAAGADSKVLRQALVFDCTS